MVNFEELGFNNKQEYLLSISEETGIEEDAVEILEDILVDLEETGENYE